MDILTGIVARIIYCSPFIVFGLMHFINAGQMSMVVPGWLPGGVFWVYITGAVMIVAAAGVITGRQGFLASLVLAAMLLIFILTIHIPGLMNPETMQMAMNGLFKDAGLMGGALVLAGTYRSTLLSK